MSVEYMRRPSNQLSKLADGFVTLGFVDTHTTNLYYIHVHAHTGWRKTNMKKSV